MRLASSLFFIVFIVLAATVWPAHTLYAQELPPPQSNWEYHLGQGLQLGNSGLTLGGYGSVRVEDLRRHPPQLVLSALSLFVSWDTGTRVHFFSELKLEDVAVTRGERTFDDRDQGIELERLYADVYLTEAATVRLGKFLTPIGRWNLIHADPLVWTTSRPLITSQPFATNTTGGMLYGSLHLLDRTVDYSAYLQVTDDLDPNQREGPFNQAGGLHLAMPLESTELGFSYANFRREQEHNERENLLGLDFLWTHQLLELTGEFLYRLGTQGPAKNEWGLFVQGAIPIPLSRRLFAIGRYEFFNPKGPFPGVHRWLIGLAFRPLPPLVLRTEYSFTHDNAAKVPEGFSASIALLF